MSRWVLSRSRCLCAKNLSRRRLNSSNRLLFIGLSSGILRFCRLFYRLGLSFCSGLRRIFGFNFCLRLNILSFCIYLRRLRFHYLFFGFSSLGLNRRLWELLFLNFLFWSLSFVSFRNWRDFFIAGDSLRSFRRRRLCWWILILVHSNFLLFLNFIYKYLNIFL